MIQCSLWLFISILIFKFCSGSHWTNDNNCGLSFSNRIIGGTLASSGKYPWLARLGYKTNIKGRYTYLCGGTLIKNNMVITAAHCLEYQDKKLEVVRLGETTILCGTPDCEDSKIQRVYIKKIHKHPKFDPSIGFADIGLLELSHPVQYTEWVRPICLINRKLEIQGQTGIAAGFGLENYYTKEIPDGLKELAMKIISGSACKSTFTEFDFNSENYICAGGNQGEDTCNGDSGGPLMKIENLGQGPRMYLIGVISFGSTKCGVGVPGIFTSIHFHFNWILKVANSNHQNR